MSKRFGKIRDIENIVDAKQKYFGLETLDDCIVAMNDMDDIINEQEKELQMYRKFLYDFAQGLKEATE